MRKVSAALLLALCLLRAADAAAPRKLLQWGIGGGYNNQLAAQRVARVATQQAIRNAVDNPWPSTQFGATRFATDVGAVTATTAAYNPCALAWGPNCWNGYYRGWGRRLFGAR